MSHPLRAALLVLCTTLFSGSALADEYSVMIGTPLTGSSIPPGRVSLGIKVDVDKSWDKLTPQEKDAWREMTELVDPEVTPPFPVPNIRGLLRKLVTPDKFSFAANIERKDDLFLIVRINETGLVSSVDIMEGTAGAKDLSDNDKLLAYIYIKALLETKFSPAMFKGQTAPSAFPLRISRTIQLR